MEKINQKFVICSSSLFLCRTIIYLHFSPVPRKTIWTSNQTFGIASLHHPNDPLHGHRTLCTRFGGRSSYRNSSNLVNNNGRCHLHILFHNWWHKGRHNYGHISGDKTNYKHSNRSHFHFNLHSYLQTGLMFAAVIAIIVVNIIDAGSFSEILREANAGGRIQFSK